MKIMFDEATGKKCSDMKSETVEQTCEFLHKMESKEIPVLIIQLDPAGENLKLEK